MNRRAFVSAAVAAGGSLVASAASVSAVARRAQTPALQYYELRRYLLRRGPHQQIVDDYWRTAAVPAMTRAGAGPIGIFNVMIGPESPTLFVLVTHATIDTFASMEARLAVDADYQRAGATYLDAVATDPAFVRMESALLQSIAGQPTLALPFGGGDAGRRARIFELRTYESHSERAALRKIEMFNTGELAIFRKAGLQPVFFGHTLVGRSLPSLTYMLVYENMAAHDQQWAAFSADPDWRALSTRPGYTDPDIVANISNLFLRPAAYSQI